LLVNCVFPLHITIHHLVACAWSQSSRAALDMRLRTCCQIVAIASQNRLQQRKIRAQTDNAMIQSQETCDRSLSSHTRRLLCRRGFVLGVLAATMSVWLDGVYMCMSKYICMQRYMQTYLHMYTDIHKHTKLNTRMHVLGRSLTVCVSRSLHRA